MEKELLNPNQSDSCVNQLLAIAREIFEAFDCDPPLEVRSAFLDISKAFDKVWHEDLLYKLKSMGLFKSRLLSFIRPNQSNIYNIFNPTGLKLLTRLRLGLRHLNEHKFRHNFQDCLNPLCSCSLEIEDTTHYFLH